MPNLNLLGSTSRVETPFIKVTIGDYIFGVYDKKIKTEQKDIIRYKIGDKYPNYIQSLNIEKINGALNTYTLNIIYAITENDDPNFFEKVFSSVSESREIIFSYGDLSLPHSFFKDEKALITKVSSSFNIEASAITYTIKAVSTALNMNAGNFTFKAQKAKPSDLIKKLLYDNSYGMQEIFYGMKDKFLVDRYNLIPGDDAVVDLDMKFTTPLDYLLYLVKSMVSTNDAGKMSLKNSVYVLNVVDDLSGIFGGPYFKITKVDKNKNIESSADVYNIDVGFISKDIIKNLSIDDNENYSIYYNYNNKLTEDQLAIRIDDNGNNIKVFASPLMSTIKDFKATEEDKTWWSKVTQFPISGQITFKGLIRPAILMSNIKLNILFYGKKHIHSGYYIITKQIDSIDSNGFKTTLNILRIKGD